MNPSGSRPDVRRVFPVIVGLSLLSLLFPIEGTGRVQLSYLAAQSVLLAAAFLLAVILFYRREGEGTGIIARDLSINVVVCAAAGALVQVLYAKVPMIPVIFFIGFPYTVFARRFTLFWVPALILVFAGGGRFLFTDDPQLVYWTAAYIIYSAVLGFRMYRDGRRIDNLQSQIKRINSDAREMMDRISEDNSYRVYDRIRGEEAARAIALDEDDYLQRLLVWGCRVFNARTGILLVPDEEEVGFFRMRAAVHRGVRVLEGLVPADKGFIHITREREGILCVSDASSASGSLSFYPPDTQVGSFLVKIVMDPKWGKDAADGGKTDKVRCVLYFDSEKINTMSLDDRTARRLDEFGSLMHRAMHTAGRLQKLTKEVSSRDAISRYAQGLTRSLNPSEIAELGLDAVSDAVRNCDGAAVMLYDNEELSVAVAKGGLEGILDQEPVLRDESSQIGLFLRRFGGLEPGHDAEAANITEIVIDHKQSKRSPFFRKGEKLDEMISFAAIPCFMEGVEDPLKAVIGVVSRKADAFGKDELEELRTIAGMMAPALDNAKQHERVDRLSRTDSLTGLLNRRHFQIVFEGKLSSLSRGYFKRLAVIMIDADRFKEVNDTYGHPVGDEVLVEIARRLKSGIRRNDAVARYGGEEFIVVLDNAGEKETYEIAEKMRHLIRSRPIVTTAGKIQITVSLGYNVRYASGSESGEELLEHADQALYKAKETGRDKVVSYKSLSSQRTGTDPVSADADTGILEEKRW